MLFAPAFHGALGILDEVLLFCVPLLVVIIILATASYRARKRDQPRERVRMPEPSGDSTVENAKSLVFSTMRLAAAASPMGRNESMPPKRRICRRATAWFG